MRIPETGAGFAQKANLITDDMDDTDLQSSKMALIELF
jgi:hypothetical protein